MWEVGRRVCQVWEPNFDGLYCSSELVVLSTKLGAVLGMVFPANAGFYGGPLYGEKPQHNVPTVQRWWDSICCFDRGDSVLCVGKF